MLSPFSTITSSLHVPQICHRPLLSLLTFQPQREVLQLHATSEHAGDTPTSIVGSQSRPTVILTCISDCWCSYQPSYNSVHTHMLIHPGNLVTKEHQVALFTVVLEIILILEGKWEQQYSPYILKHFPLPWKMLPVHVYCFTTKSRMLNNKRKCCRIRWYQTLTYEVDDFDPSAVICWDCVYQYPYQAIICCNPSLQCFRHTYYS